MLQDCLRFQMFSCTLECVSGLGVEPFLPGAGSSWLLIIGAVLVHPGEQGAGDSLWVGTLSGVQKSSVTMPCMEIATLSMGS